MYIYIHILMSERERLSLYIYIYIYMYVCAREREGEREREGGGEGGRETDPDTHGMILNHPDPHIHMSSYFGVGVSSERSMQRRTSEIHQQHPVRGHVPPLPRSPATCVM